MRIIQSAIERPVTIAMSVVAVILFGLVSLDRLALDLLPEISYPSLTIQTDFEDAAPEEVETLVTEPIEEAVGVIPGLRQVYSISRSGQSEVVMEFSWDTDMDVATMEVREKLDFVRLPRDAEKPVILRFDPSHDPVLRIRLLGEGLPLSELREAAEKEIKKYLEATEGVAAVKVIGGLEEQIEVAVDERRLAELGISITEVTEAIRRENLNQATGSLYDGDANYLVRMLNQFRTVEEIRSIVIRRGEVGRIILGDVARVWQGYKDREIITRLDGQECVELAVYKEGDANTVGVARAVLDRLQSLSGSPVFPAGARFEVVSNQAEFIESSVSNVLSAAILGGVLAVAVLLVFLRDLRSTVAIGFSIPISIMATFALMYQSDVTLNIMSLGGVALGVGMLVDNSIVVLEAVARHRRGDIPLKVAVFRGASEVSRAVTASTLTTVAVFLPLVFVEGIAGQLFKDQALTITYSLLASLLVALLVIPTLLARTSRRWEEEASCDLPGGNEGTLPGGGTAWLALPRRWSRAGLRFLFVELPTVVLRDVRNLWSHARRGLQVVTAPALGRFDRLLARVTDSYPAALDWCLRHKGVVFGTVLAAGAAAGFLVQRLGGELIPPLRQGEFVFHVFLPEGRALEETARVMRGVEEAVAAFPEVEFAYTSIGGSAENQFARNALRENEAQLYVVLRERTDAAAEESVVRRLRRMLAGIPDVRFELERPMLFSLRTPIEVEVYSYDLEHLREGARRVAAELRRIPGLADIRTTAEEGDPEIHVVFDREKLARLGLDEDRVAAILRNKIRGDVASRFREGDRQIDIVVRAAESRRKTVEDLTGLHLDLPAAGGSSPPGVASIPLRAVAEIQQEKGPSEIRHVRGRRAALVSANLEGRDLESATRDVHQLLDRLRGGLPPDTTLQLGGQNQELAGSYASFLFALGLAVFLVYLVMASEFESLIHPFVIIFSVPLGVVGVVFTLWLTGTNLSVMVLLGVIVLAGIVVNNAIVLIDYANQLRGRGLGRREALKEAGRIRLRPILMTTLTTVLGLFPMALGWGEGAEVRAPMAVTVMGGLVFSTLLTLLFIPVLYDLLDRKVVGVAARRPREEPGLWFQPAEGE